MIVLIFLTIIIYLLYLYGTRNFDYWAKRSVKHDTPLPFFGNCISTVFRKINMADTIHELYLKYPNERVVGCYGSNIPILIVRDPELVKAVMVTDFKHFYSRGVLLDKVIYEPILKNIFSCDGDLWKLLKQIMLPAFTTAKIKAMFPLIVEMTELLKNKVDDLAQIGEDTDLREVMARYTTDFIGAVGFGINSKSLHDENSLFRQIGKRIFTVTKFDALRLVLKKMFPETFKKMHILDPIVEKNIVQLLQDILKQRDYKPSGRNDFVDLLMECKQRGKIVTDSIEHYNSDGSPKTVELELDENLMAAQVFLFFAAGFETTSSTTSFTLHQLAFHPDAQRKCQQEIDEVLRRHDNQLCYDAVKEMKYLEMCFRESMRMFPPTGFLMRKCEKLYQVPGTDFTIDSGVLVTIPVRGLHNDEKYHHNPDVFIPERFSDMNGLTNKICYLPFGTGPRACIGERLGLMLSLAGLAALLQTHSVMPSRHSQRIPETDPTSYIVQNVKGGIPLKIVARNKI